MPFAKGNQIAKGHKGAGGRPPLTWRALMAARNPKAFKVLDLALDGKVKSSLQWAAAKDVLDRAVPIKQEVAVEGKQTLKVIVEYAGDRDTSKNHPQKASPRPS